MGLLRVVLVAFTFLFAGAVQATPGVLENVTVKSVRLSNAFGFAILEASFVENVTLSACPASVTSKNVSLWEPNLPGAWINAWSSMLMSAQAQELKVSVNYECTAEYGALINSVIITR